MPGADIEFAYNDKLAFLAVIRYRTRMSGARWTDVGLL